MDYQCLMVDDDLIIAQATAEYFNMFDIRTAYVTSYEEAENFLGENSVGLILLDVNLGERSGFELCRRIRRELDVPVLFISARTSDDDILTALNIGGDDYITKPYTLNILLAKAKAVLRRCAMNGTVRAEKESVGNIVPVAKNITLDTNAMKLIKNGESIVLKSMEFKVLRYLLDNRARIITKNEFFDNVWKEQFIGEGTLSVHIRRLREKIEDDPNDPTVIKTVWGVGYIMEEYEKV